jgi:hypothetical protein
MIVVRSREYLRKLADQRYLHTIASLWCVMGVSAVAFIISTDFVWNDKHMTSANPDRTPDSEVKAFALQPPKPQSASVRLYM